MNVTIKQLKIFLGVAQSKSFTKTAQALHISQSALSVSIQELENLSQSRLFERTTRTVQLTEAGLAFLPVAHHIVETLERASTDLDRIRRIQQTTLRVGFTPFVAGSLAPLALRTFEAENPLIKVEIYDKTPNELLSLVEQGKIDAAYGAYFEKSSGIHKDLICPTHLCLVRPTLQEGKKTQPKTLKWSELNDQVLICLPQDNPIQRLIEEQLVKHHIRLQKRREVAQIETQIAMTEAKNGVALVPSLATSICERYDVSLQALNPKLSIDFYCIQKTGLGFSSSITQFSNILKNLIVQ
jgi:DNA-binding transcriptional LysR family regulator